MISVEIIPPAVLMPWIMFWRPTSDVLLWVLAAQVLILLWAWWWQRG